MYKINLETITCKICQNNYSRQVRKIPRENLCAKCKRIDTKNKNIEQHKQNIRKWNKNYYMKNRENLIKYNFEHRLKNKEHYKEYVKKYQQETSQAKNFYKKFSTKELIVNSVYGTYKMSSKMIRYNSENFINTLTKDDIKDILEQQNYKCYFTNKSFINVNMKLFYPSIYRINRKIGFTKDNCVIVILGLAFCKHSESTTTIQQFLKHIKRDNINHYQNSIELNKNNIYKRASKYKIKTSTIIEQYHKQNFKDYFTNLSFCESNRMLSSTCIKFENDYIITFSAFARLYQHSNKEEFLEFIDFILNS